MAETAGEVIAMELPDVDLKAGSATVRRGKGGRHRNVAFGPRTGRTMDRYIRLCRSHRLADTPTLWLGDRGTGFTYYRPHSAMRYRAELAGFDPHLLRHTAASLIRGGIAFLFSLAVFAGSFSSSRKKD